MSKFGRFWTALVAVLSVAAYRIAVFVAQFLITGSTVPMATVHQDRFWYAGVAAGCVGSAMLVGAAWLLRLGPVDGKRGLAVVGAGALAGALLNFWPMRAGDADFHVGPFILLIPWQAAVAAMLGQLCGSPADSSGL